MTDMPDAFKQQLEEKRKKEEEEKAKKALEAQAQKSDGSGAPMENMPGRVGVIRPGDATAGKSLDSDPAARVGITEEALVKALGAVEAVVKSGPGARKAELLSKAQKEDLTAAEAAELNGLVTHAPSATGPQAEVSKAMTTGGGEGFQKAIEVDDYLADQHAMLVKSLAIVAESVEKSDQRAQMQIRNLAEGILAIGGGLMTLMKGQSAMAEKLGIVMRQPARGGKAVAQVSAAGVQAAQAGPQALPTGQAPTRAFFYGKIDALRKAGYSQVCGMELDKAETSIESDVGLPVEVRQALISFKG